jgi:ribosomal protein S18 acetylase RimI-like enzyme
MNESSPRFRLADPADSAKLGEFMARNFLAAYGHCSSPENVAAAVARHYGEPAQLRQILDPDRHNLLMLIGEDWVGHGQLNRQGPAPAAVTALPTLELSRFYVDTRFHGSGAAQAMMAEIKREARARDAASLWLSVWQESPQAIRFYEKQGFRIAGQLIFMVGDDPKDDWLMVCDLT